MRPQKTLSVTCLFKKKFFKKSSSSKVRVPIIYQFVRNASNLSSLRVVNRCYSRVCEFVLDTLDAVGGLTQERENHRIEKKIQLGHLYPSNQSMYILPCIKKNQ